MASRNTPSAELRIPRRETWKHSTAISAPGYESFITRFGHAFPKPHFLESDLGVTAVYDVPPPSGKSKRRVLITHGLNTPALGMLSLAYKLQALDPDTHLVLYDLWGHGLSSTPLTAHAPQIFHSQMFQVLGHMQWSSAHLIGFSFGGITVVNFALHNPRVALSATLLAPAGLLKREVFGKELLDLMDSSGDKDSEAADRVLDWLEGGPLVLPTDWQERSRAGEVVAEALREWELQNHAGYRKSILSVFRDGGVNGSDAQFEKLAQSSIPTLGVAGELDPVCGKSQLVELGFKNAEEVKGGHHDFVRREPFVSETADLINQFWKHNR